MGKLKAGTRKFHRASYDDIQRFDEWDPDQTHWEWVRHAERETIEILGNVLPMQHQRPGWQGMLFRCPVPGRKILSLLHAARPTTVYTDVPRARHWEISLLEYIACAWREIRPQTPVECIADLKTLHEAYQETGWERPTNDFWEGIWRLHLPEDCWKDTAGGPYFRSPRPDAGLDEIMTLVGKITWDHVKDRSGAAFVREILAYSPVEFRSRWALLSMERALD